VAEGLFALKLLRDRGFTDFERIIFLIEKSGPLEDILP